jgi:RNA polymerase sigma factor (sigma-70 family)
MGNGLTVKAAHQVARVFRDGTLVGMSDRQVLERFVERRDETAFEAILMRHGPMVRNVCRQILFDPHDVDDAVQAVFLVLVRKASFIRIEESLGPWLYAVAGRVAARARADRRKRWVREAPNREQREPTYCTSGDDFEIPDVIHDELGRLPERLRAPIVLCYLEGLTHDLAALKLDCPVGTVRSRLARARGLLHRRISRRGLTLSTAGLVGILESNALGSVASSLPASLVESITHAMIEAVQSNSVGYSATFATILEGVLNVSLFKKIAILSGAISVGAIAFAVAEQRTVGQTPEPVSHSIEARNGPRQGGSAAPAPREDPRVLAIESKLDERISTNIDEQPLGEAVSYLQNYTGLNIVIDPKALSEAGLTASSPVSLTVKQVPLKSVLKFLLRPLGLTYKIEDHVILISSPSAVSARTYNRTYYVGDLVPPWGSAAPPETPTAPAAGERQVVDLTPLMELIELMVAPGTWNVQDGYGYQLSPKSDSAGKVGSTQPNAMVPFFLSVSLILTGSEDVHQNVAKLLRGLRRLRYGGKVDNAPLVARSAAQPVGERVNTNPAPTSTAGSRKRIDQLLDSLREEVRKLESAPPGASVVPLQR